MHVIGFIVFIIVNILMIIAAETDTAVSGIIAIVILACWCFYVLLITGINSVNKDPIDKQTTTVTTPQETAITDHDLIKELQSRGYTVTAD